MRGRAPLTSLSNSSTQTVFQDAVASDADASDTDGAVAPSQDGGHNEHSNSCSVPTGAL